MSTASRVIKNTGFLYAKMGITVFVSLYTTRLILASLGASDFGIFNVVGGAIGMLGFLNSTLANATQRFMSYAEGEGKLENKRKIFNVSISLHLAIAVATAVLLIGVMPILFESVLNIELDRKYAAKIVYCSLIVSTFLTIINVPYDAVMNAHENMLYYSIIGIFESLLRLTVAFVCVYSSSSDKLVTYGVLMACIPFITLSIMKIYCHRKYDECILKPLKYWDINLVKTIASFSGWNFLTAISSLFTAQGMGLVLNHFFGTKLNAAQGVANQLNGQLSSFSTTMLKALNPIIVKSAGSKDIEFMNKVTITGCKFSALLIMLFAVPFIIEMNYVMGLWLKSVPEWATTFCILQLVQTIICQMANPAATAVYAQGDIKWYAIYKSIMNIMPIILTYISFNLGGSPIWLYIPMIAIWAIGGDVVIITYAKKKCGLMVSYYFKSVVRPIFIIGISMITFGYLPVLFIPESFVRLVITGIITFIALISACYIWGLNKDEKQIIKSLLDKAKQYIKHK